MRSRSYFGDGVLLIFLFAQLADGALTYVGVRVFGLEIEANPIVSWYIAAFGVGAALVAAKLLAATCAMTLHMTARHRTVGVLTILYLAAAVWPWATLFSVISE
jgi:hypothetical protein